MEEAPFQVGHLKLSCVTSAHLLHRYPIGQNEIGLVAHYELLSHVRSEWSTHERKRVMTQELLTCCSSRSV